eukprot:3440201-Pleurochrysis_carterae.AAC.1
MKDASLDSCSRCSHGGHDAADIRRPASARDSVYVWLLRFSGAGRSQGAKTVSAGEEYAAGWEPSDDDADDGEDGEGDGEDMEEQEEAEEIGMAGSAADDDDDHQGSDAMDAEALGEAEEEAARMELLRMRTHRDEDARFPDEVRATRTRVCRRARVQSTVRGRACVRGLLACGSVCEYTCPRPLASSTWGYAHAPVSARTHAPVGQKAPTVIKHGRRADSAVSSARLLSGGHPARPACAHALREVPRPQVDAHLAVASAGKRRSRAPHASAHVSPHATAHANPHAFAG